MAELDHGLSLADALTEPPPQIEEEVKRDFIATLEAEKFDDVVGEKVGKTDYVPLLDDDDMKAGTQEVKTKPHADQVERASATGPAGVVENGDHGIEGGRKVSPGKIMDDQLSYKEFLDRNDSWQMGERDRCFDSQLAFKPPDMTEPFKMHREDVLSNLLLLPQEMTGMPTFGDYFGAPSEVHVPFGAAGMPEQPPLGPPHSPANVFDPLAFLGEDLGAESLLNQNEAVPANEMGLPEDFFSGTRPLVEAQGAPFFEPPAPGKMPEETELFLPGSVVMGFPDLPGEPKAPEANPFAPAGSAVPDPAEEELVGFEPWFDQRSLPPTEAATTSLEATVAKNQKAKAVESADPAAFGATLEKEEGKKAPLGQHKEKESSSQFFGLQSEEAAMSKSSAKASESQAGKAAEPPPDQEADQEAVWPEAGGRELHALKAEDDKTAPSQQAERVEETQASFGQPAEEAAAQPLGPQADESKPSRAQHAAKAEGGQPSGKQEEDQPPSSPSQSQEHLPALDERSKESPSKPVEKQDEQKQPPTKPVEHFPELEESKEPVPLGQPKAEPQEPFPGTAALEFAGAEKPKEVPEPSCDQPVEQPQEKASPDPEGVSTAQVRQANKSSDHRRFAKSKTSQAPLAESPGELLARFPAQKSRDQGEDLFASPERGYVAGTSPRGKPAARKVVGQLFDLGEGQRDALQESWDLEASAALKKKKKKPKQKRSQHPRPVETWEESSERLGAPVSADEPRKSHAPLAVPLESSQVVTGVSMGVLWKGTSKPEMEQQLLDAQSVSSAPAKGEPIQHPEGSLKLESDAKTVESGRAEVMSDDRALLLSKSRKKGSSKEQVKGPTKLNKPGSPTVSPAQASPAAISIFGEFTAWEGHPPKNLDLDMPALEAKPTVSCSAAVSGEDAKPADVSGKEAVAGRVVLEGKPKHQGGRGKGRGAGEEAAGSPLEGKMLGMPAFEAKTTVSCSAAVSGEDAKPADVSGKEAVAGRVVLEGKPKHQGGRGKGRGAGEEAAGSPLEGKMLGMPAFEAKPTVSCSAAVSGEDAKPADVSGKEAVAGRVVLEGKLKQQGGRGRGGRAGEEAAGFPLEGKMLGMPAFEAKPTVSCSTAVSGEDAKPADVSGKEAVAGRVVLEGKPKQQGGRGRGGRAGEEAAGSPLEGKMLGMPALEAKPTVSCSTAVSGEDAKPSDVSGKEAVAGRVVLEGKLKQQGGLRRGGRAGEEAAGFPLEGMMLEASKERAFPGQSSPVVSELAPLAAAGASPDDRNVSSPRKSEKTAFGSGEGAFSREACPDTAKPPVPREDLVGGGTIPLADTNEAVCSSPSEKPAVAVLQVEAGQPHKRSSSGESRKVEDSLGQQPLPSEVASDSRQGLAADEVAVPPKTDPGAPSQEVSLSGLAESKAAHGPAGTGERPKKRSSDRKSRKAAERSSFAPSFFLEEEKIAGGLPADQVKEKAVSSRETASEAANQSLEVAADPAKSDARSALPQVGKPNVPPPSKGEWADFPSSAYPFIMETPAKTPGADAQTEGIAVPYQGKGFGSSSLEGSVTVEPGSIALTSKPKKRTSDGRSKKSGKPAAEHPEPSAGVNRPRKAGSTKGTDAVDQGNSTPLEQPGGSRGPFPALKLMEGPEGKKDEDSIAAAGRNSFSEHLPASAHKTSPVQPEPLAKIKDASSTRKGQEVSLAALEQLAEAVTTPREPEGPEYAGQSPQLHGLLEAKPDAAGPAAACKEVGQTEKGPSPAKGKGRAAGSLVRDAAAAGQVSDEPLVDETIKGVPEGMTGKISSGVNPLFPLGFGAEQVLGAETCEKPKGHSSDRRRKEGRDGSSELASRQDLSAKPAKRGSDGKSKKATGSPEQPVLAPPKPEPSRGQRPQGAELNYALEETEFVDENRNIKRFPPGHPMLWDENTMSLFGPFGPPGPAALEEAGSKSQCPFLKYQGKAAADLRKEQLPPPETPRGPSGGGWADTPGLPEDSAAGEIREAMIEASLLVTAGDKTRERRKKTRQAALDRAAKGDAKAEEDRVLSSVLAEAGGGGVNLSEKIPSFGLSSSELAVTEEKTAALTTGAGAEGREAVVPSAELPAPWEDSKEVVALQALTTALVGGPGEPVGSNEGTEVDKQRASECPESLGSKAGVDKASEDVPATEAASANKPQGSSEPPEQGAANEPVVYQPVLPAGQEEPTRKAAEQMNAQGPVSETGQSVAGGLQTAAERPDQAARETKREERARPVEQIKGYMRPTKSRGLPPPPLRAAAPEPGKRRPAKADGPGPHRQERVLMPEFFSEELVV